jgi:hypothetical protein
LGVERVQPLFFPAMHYFGRERAVAGPILYFFVYIDGGKVHNISIIVQKDVRGNGP